MSNPLLYACVTVSVYVYVSIVEVKLDDTCPIGYYFTLGEESSKFFAFERSQIRCLA